MEYAGYVSRGSIDWSGIAKGLQENVNKGLQERQKKIDEDNKLFEDTRKKLGEYENTQSPSYNTRAYQLTDQSRGYLLDLKKKLESGEITRSEYKMSTNNLYEQYDSFINTSKQFDQYISEVNKKIQSGEAGAEFVAKANANMAFMGLADGSAELQVGPDGGIYVSKSGNENPISIKQWTNIQNLADGKIDVNEQVSKFTDKVADVVRSSTAATGASVTTDDARQMTEQYNAIKRNAVATVANRNNPSAIVSILMDNSDLGYQIFMSNNDIQKAVQNEVQKQEWANREGVALTEEQKQKIKSDIESKAIMYNMSGDGTLNPVLTDGMIADAEKVAGEYFEAQIDSKITTEAAQMYRGKKGNGDGDGGGSGKEPKQTDYSLYEEMADAWGSGDSATLNTLLLDKTLKLENVGGDMSRVVKIDPKTGKVVSQEHPPTSNLSDLIPYFFGRGATATKKGQDQREAWLEATGGVAPKTTTTTKKTTATTIKSSDIPAKAKAAGYTTEEYKKLLKDKGIKII